MTYLLINHLLQCCLMPQTFHHIILDLSIKVNNVLNINLDLFSCSRLDANINLDNNKKNFSL